MGKRKPYEGFSVFSIFITFFFVCSSVESQSSDDDASAMQALKKSLGNPTTIGWDDQNPCNWEHVQCEQTTNRITRIQIGRLNLAGTLPSELQNLTELLIFEVMSNQLTGAIPNLAGLSKLQEILFSNNGFTSIPLDFFTDMSGLINVVLDNNPFTPWQIPDSLKNAVHLSNFSATNCSIIGQIPEFLGNSLPSLAKLHLGRNSLIGGIPQTFSGSSINSLWLNGNKLNGSISVLQNMTSLIDAQLNLNQITGPLPDFSGLTQLQVFDLRDNKATGLVPLSLTDLPSLQTLNLTNNLLQGPMPKFTVPNLDLLAESNRFCLNQPGVVCDDRVNILLSIVSSFGYPEFFADNWNDNDPCIGWTGISCSQGDIIGVNLQNMKLPGTISPDFSKLKSVQKILLSNNNLTGTIPKQLTSLPSLAQLDVSNNNLVGEVPAFKNVLVNTSGNLNIGKDPPPPPGSPSGSPPGSTITPPSSGSGSERKSSNIGLIIGLICGALVVCALMAICLITWKRKRGSGRVQSPNKMVIHPQFSDDHGAIKIAIANSSTTNGNGSETNCSGSDAHVVEAGSMIISIQVLKTVTENFSEANVLGRGGFGTVYKGELHDGTLIAVKRMEGLMSEKGLAEFKSEIAVLTKVRHRHLVALLGYCLDGNERLLVYEYMPQGTLSRFLFHWKAEGLKPLGWTRRLIIALDVARGVEYLHGLAHQSFIHRDLKPSNILLGDDLRAKVADFGLVRHAPEGANSIETRLAGTFGYLAPEYAVTGRLSTKVDVFSFGVILMELITGRKALDESQPEESLHLVTWFRRIYISKNEFEKKAIDSTIDLDEVTLASVNKVAELAGHCTAREYYQRPDMGHVVNVLSTLAENWKPTEPANDDIYGNGIDFNMTLPQALKKWRDLEGNDNTNSTFDNSSSSLLPSNDNTQTSISTRPSGFGDSFTSADCR